MIATGDRPRGAAAPAWVDAPPYVRLEGLTKRFGEVTAVDDLTLDIRKGEFFSLLGPSGCGKSTLLRMLAGLETPTGGRILLDGEDITDMPPHRRPVNMMFQSYALFPHMSVEKNVAFGLKQEGLAKGEIAERVARMLDRVQLAGLAARKPHQLSGGQRQRVALARSLVKQPKLLLLDEPLGALDKKLRERTQFELVDIQEQTGITFVIVTHDQEEAMTVSSRIAVMSEGRIVQVATPEEIYETPNSRYVAEFIGDVNLLEGEVREATDERTLVASEVAGCDLRGGGGSGLSAGDRVWVAVRPEKLDISRTPPADETTNCLQGEVWDIGYLGNLDVYHVRLDSGRRVTAVQANRARILDREITWEDRVYLTWRDRSTMILPG